MSAPRDWPLATAELPGTGGAPAAPEDFIVEEIPAYLPAGAGEHCFLFIEKRGLTTPQALDQLCRALGAARAGAGYAGLKDKHGVTRQWVSLHNVRCEAVRGVALEGLRILEARLHRNKLHTGHLRGNRFAITLRGVTGDDATGRASAVLARLTAEGLPNYYGAQRFGRGGDNAERGLALLRGAGGGKGGKRGGRDRTQHRLLISALQSLLFNEVLGRRLAPAGPGLRRLLGGEVLQRTDSGGLFVSEDDVVDGARLARGEVVVTGPIAGPRMPLPRAGSAALALEEEVFAAHAVTPADFAALGRLARGGRRPLAVTLEGAVVEPVPDDAAALLLRFALPAGSYATVLLREVTKAAPGDGAADASAGDADGGNGDGDEADEDE